MCGSEYDAWPDDLREAWASLNAPEQRLLLRARWRWRGWPNPGPNPPKHPWSSNAFHVAWLGLYAQELAYREWSACRGADGVVTVTTHTREEGTRAKSTPADLAALLTANPEGLTLTEIHDALPDVARRTLAKWLDHAHQFGAARSRQKGAALLWYPKEIAP